MVEIFQLQRVRWYVQLLPSQNNNEMSRFLWLSIGFALSFAQNLDFFLRNQRFFGRKLHIFEGSHLHIFFLSSFSNLSRDFCKIWVAQTAKQQALESQTVSNSMQRIWTMSTKVLTEKRKLWLSLPLQLLRQEIPLKLLAQIQNAELQLRK